MRRKLLILNLALAVLVVGAAWRLRAGWQEALEREKQVLAGKPAAAPYVQPEPASQPPAVTAAAYGEIAQQMLFAPDRNPDVVVEVAPLKPLPPLPVAHGVVNFGDGPVVILSEKPGAAHAGYSPGDRVGEFKLVAVSPDELVLEFDGRQVKKSLSELRGEGAVPAASAAAASPPSSPQTAVVPVQAPVQTTVETPLKAGGPGVIMYGRVRACQPGDTSPPGTVVNGMRKMESASPLGRVCWWEPVE